MGNLGWILIPLPSSWHYTKLLRFEPMILLEKISWGDRDITQGKGIISPYSELVAVTFYSVLDTVQATWLELQVRIGLTIIYFVGFVST